MHASRRTLALAAGVLYLVTHVTSVTAVVAYGAGAITTGALLEFVLALACAGTGILLWLLLRYAGPVRAAAFGLLRLLEASVILAGVLPMVALTMLAAPSTPTVALLTQLHTASFLVGQGLVISVNTLILAWLLLDARAVPRPLAVLGLAGGAIVLASNLAQLFGLIPLNGAIAGACAVPVFAFELWFAIHLIVRGVATRERMPAATAQL
jgi:hypothetical protein